MPNLKRINYALTILPFLLFSIGYLTHLSTSAQRAQSHLFFFGIGVIAYAVFSLIDYHLFELAYKPLYLGILLALIAVLFFGNSVLGSSRWLDIGFVTFQPSEIAKLALILFVSFYLYNKKEKTPNKVFLTNLFLAVAPIIILVLIQPDLGTSIILMSIVFGTLFLNGLSSTFFIATFSIFGILSAPIWALLKEYQRHRILVFLNPSLDTLGRGYNVIQSLIAVGSGGLWGKGFGRGTQNHLNFLPVYWTDFVIASFAEEWGLVGVLLVLISFFVLFIVILYILNTSSDALGRYLCSGVFFVFLVQFVINIGMNIGLLPVTGITLPFLSHGGTSIVIAMAMLGIVHSVWLNSQKL